MIVLEDVGDGGGSNMFVDRLLVVRWRAVSIRSVVDVDRSGCVRQRRRIRRVGGGPVPRYRCERARIVRHGIARGMERSYSTEDARYVQGTRSVLVVMKRICCSCKRDAQSDAHRPPCAGIDDGILRMLDDVFCVEQRRRLHERARKGLEMYHMFDSWFLDVVVMSEIWGRCRIVVCGEKGGSAGSHGIGNG